MKHSPVIMPHDKDEYQVKESFFYMDENFEVWVPYGTIFDGASIPRILWTTTGSPFLPQFVGPALIHDYLYVKCKDQNKRVTKKQADKLFHKLLRENGVGRYQAWKMHRAVRMFGKGNFNK